MMIVVKFDVMFVMCKVCLKDLVVVVGIIE